jgi:RNA polymerase sigma-70 factor, ECF subfamily
MADDSDHELIAQVLKGDITAFEKLVRRYEDRLYNTVFRLLGNKEDAQDVVQESFVQAYLTLHTFRRDSQFFTWLYRIAYNTAVQFKRMKRGGSGTFPVITTPDEERRRIMEALKQLAPEHKEVLNYKDIDGLNYAEIAEILGIPIGTVRARLHQARLELNRVLENQPNDPSQHADRPFIVDLSKLTDAQLIAESVNGNHWAYHHLMTRYREQLDAMIAELVPKRTGRESLRKAVVAVVPHLLPTFPREMSFASWLYQVAKRATGQ